MDSKESPKHDKGLPACRVPFSWKVAHSKPVLVTARKTPRIFGRHKIREKNANCFSFIIFLFLFSPTIDWNSLTNQNKKTKDDKVLPRYKKIVVKFHLNNPS